MVFELVEQLQLALREGCPSLFSLRNSSGPSIEAYHNLILSSLQNRLSLSVIKPMADPQRLFKQGALAAWYETAKSALYLNRTLREWLDSYAEAQRPEAARLALVHGITCLRKSFGNKVLSLEQLKHVTGQGQHALVLQEELPSLYHGVAQIRQLLDGFDQDLSIDNTIQQPQRSPGFSQNHRQPAKQQSGCQDAAAEAQPACIRHGHQDAAAQQHSHQQIYPSWWGHQTPQLVPQHVKGSQQQPRPPPRLAYSVKQEPELGKPLHSNDLVTGAYLDVPSSGYAAAQPMSATRRALTWKGPADKPTADSPSAQIREGKENTSGTAEVEHKGSKLKQHVVVKSRVKEQLQQAHSLHQQRGKARQQRLQAALGPRHPPAPQKFHSTPRQRSTQGQYRTEQPPADIADSILTNPWTAALMQGDCDRPQLYSNSLALTRIGIGSWAAGPAHAHAHAASQPSLQAQPQSQQAPENSVTADPSSSDTAAASLHSSQEEDEHRLESGPDKQGTDSCSSVGEDGAGSVGGDSRSHDDCNHRHMPSTQDKPQAWRQDQSRRAGPMQRSASSAASDSQQADARSDSSSDKASSGKARSGNGRSDWGCSNKASSDRRSSAAASGGNAQPTRHTDWAADFTSKHGEQAQGLQQHAAAAKSEEVKVAGGRQRGFTSWIGDFGHLEGPRFNKQQGRAWQAHMHSQREQPPDSSSSPNFIAEESNNVTACDTEKDHENEALPTPSSTNDGRWDFASILRENL